MKHTNRAARSPSHLGEGASEDLEVVQRVVGRATRSAAGREDGADSSGATRAAARHGVSGGGGALPFLEAIQRSFGRHDVRHIQAHTDDRARAGAEAMGAEAFATGERVALDRKSTRLNSSHNPASRMPSSA
jgi:hypothetical protein